MKVSRLLLNTEQQDVWLQRKVLGIAPNYTPPKYQVTLQNIAKGTTDPRIEFISQVLTQILIKFLLKNLHQALTSKSQPNMNISSKVKLKNIDKT